ncbi:ABC transporter ATP-binding protein [Dactylosporangium sp. CA-233914]|uniref:ABC transporter ATP-binding protein n=1 Tax=Dactylosporangium sp. CA-233914 TaxID=3239934 RepID=UPI003D9316B9
MAVVGESGSGKSVSMRALLGLYTDAGRVSVAGSARLDGVDLVGQSRRRLRAIRGNRIALIAQDALASLNPSLTVGYQLCEAIRLHKRWDTKRVRARAIELLNMVGIPSASSRLSNYPHEFSGGMRQRVLIAIGLAADPEILIADEPTTALDVTIQAQILLLLQDIQSQTGLGLIMITHDMGVVAETADRVCVMYAGSVLESGAVTDVFASPRHPYSVGLLDALPRLDRIDERLKPIPGNPPRVGLLTPGCTFAPRCYMARPECASHTMALETVGVHHRSACMFWDRLENSEETP